MSRVKAERLDAGWWRRTFASLRVRNYRRFFVGQAISLVGTWMQTLAQAWLVLQLTGSATMLGVVAAVQTLPMLLLAPYGGLIADRADKRRVLIATQSAMAVLALVLGLLTLTGTVRIWMVLATAAALGLTTSVDNPTRQAFVPEMVGTTGVGNAVSLNSVLVNAARAVGPAVAGLLIVTVGVADCFLLNAVSFVAVIVALAGMDASALTRAKRASAGPGRLVEGLRYVRRTPELLTPLLMMALVGTLSYEFQVVLPVLAKQTFGGNADAFGFLTASLGAGAVVGGPVVAGRGPRGLQAVVVASAAFGGAMLLAAMAPTLVLELAALVLVGAASISFMAQGNTTLQLAATDSMRGRVMALWTVAFLGSTPIGGPIVGYVSQYAGPRWGLALGGVAALVAAGLGALGRPRSPRWPSPRQAPARRG